MLRELHLDDAAPWKQRFRAATIATSQVAGANPVRGLVVSDRASEALQLGAWGVPNGQLRPLTDRPEGVWEGWISPDGRYVYYLHDTLGQKFETGSRMARMDELH